MIRQHQSGRPRWVEALAELHVGADEMPGLLHVLEAVETWAPTGPTENDTARLIARLRPEVESRTNVTTGLADLVAVARAQAMILTPAFWIASVVVMAVGVGLAVMGMGGSRAIALYLAGPLMSYVGTSMGFRASTLRTWELELTGALGARQLTLARMFIVVGYQAVVGLFISLPLWAVSSSAIGVILEWLGPLLLATGLTLVLSLWIRVETAGLMVYAAWATLTILVWRFQPIGSGGGVAIEEAIGVAGLILLGVAIAAAPWQLARSARRTAQMTPV